MTWHHKNEFKTSTTWVKQKSICNKFMPEYLYGKKEEPHNHVKFTKDGKVIFHAIRRDDITPIFYGVSLVGLNVHIQYIVHAVIRVVSTQKT